MKLAMIGVGQAGGKVVDAALRYDRRSGGRIVHAALAVNTARADLMGLDLVPVANRILIGGDRVKGHGVGADNELGAAIADADLSEIERALDTVPAHGVDAFLVIAALGGGTGSGGAPVIARELKRRYADPVFGLGILPASDEGGIYTLNAARSLPTFVDEVDNLILVDNDAWRRSGETVASAYTTINDEIATRMGVLFGAGEAAAGGGIGESVVDASEIINTLAGGGISTLGYATVPVELRRRGLVDRLLGGGTDEDFEATNRITSLIRKAALGRLTLPCEVGSAERALVVVAGPPEFIDRKGIERGRSWLETETGSMEVRGGDYPLPDESKVAAVVLLAGVTTVPRIDALQAIAVEAQGVTEEQRAASRARQRDLLGGGDELEPLF